MVVILPVSISAFRSPYIFSTKRRPNSLCKYLFIRHFVHWKSSHQGLKLRALPTTYWCCTKLHQCSTTFLLVQYGLSMRRSGFILWETPVTCSPNMKYMFFLLIWKTLSSTSERYRYPIYLSLFHWDIKKWFISWPIILSSDVIFHKAM